jgi:hypothetical protein
MEDYDWFLNLVNFFCSLYVPYKCFKSLLDADKEIATIIRCQKSIQYIRTTKTEGYIDYDSKLDEKFKKLELDLRCKLKEARKERKQFSMGAIPPSPHQSINVDSDSNRLNNVESDLNQSIEIDFDFFGYDL